MSDDLQPLRDAGGLVGESTAASWRELVAAFDVEKVRFAIARCRVESRGRQASCIDVAKSLKYPLAGVAAPKRKLSPAPTDRTGTEQVEHARAAERQMDRIAKPTAAAAPPAVLSEPSAALEPKPSTFKKGVDYAAILRQFGPISITGLCARARVKDPSARYWVKQHAAELLESGYYPKRYAMRASCLDSTPSTASPKPPTTADTEISTAAPTSAASPAKDSIVADAVDVHRPTESCIQETVAANSSISVSSMRSTKCRPGRRRKDTPSSGPACVPTVERGGTSLVDLVLDRDLAELIEEIIDMWCDHHDLELYPRARKRLLKTCKGLGL